MMKRRKYKGRITAGWPRDMWPEVKRAAAEQKAKETVRVLVFHGDFHKPRWTYQKVKGTTK